MNCKASSLRESRNSEKIRLFSYNCEGQFRVLFHLFRIFSFLAKNYHFLGK